MQEKLTKHVPIRIDLQWYVAKQARIHECQHLDGCLQKQFLVNLEIQRVSIHYVVTEKMMKMKLVMMEIIKMVMAVICIVKKSQILVIN